MTTFQEQIKALPEDDRVAFFRGIFAVCEAGRKANIPAQEFAKVYAQVYNHLEEKNT